MGTPTDTPVLRLFSLLAVLLLAAPSLHAQSPEGLWDTAAQLQQSLSEAERDALIQRADALRAQRQARRAERSEARPDGQRGRRMRGQRGRRARRGVMRRGLATRALQDHPLTDAQREQLQSLRDEARAEMRALGEARRDGSLERDVLRERARALRETQRERLQSLLTPEQRAEIEAAQAQRTDRRRERRGDRFDAMADALDLSTSQRDALQQAAESQCEAARAQRDALRSGDRDARRAFREQMRAQREASLEQILTPDQLETVQLYRALRIQAAAEGQGRRGRRR